MSEDDPIGDLTPEQIKLLKHMAEEESNRKLMTLEPGYAERLVELAESLNVKHNFKIGDLVVWKSDMKNKTRPVYGSPVVIMELLDEPLLPDDYGAGSAYFREPIDLGGGQLDEDGELVVFWYDSRRFEPYDPESYFPRARG